MAGIKSRNVCVIAKEVMKTTRIIAGKNSKETKEVTIIKVIRLTWIPGVNPVKIPKKIPTKIARRNSSNINYQEGRSLYLLRFSFFNI